MSEVRHPGTDEQQETLITECTSVPPVAGELPCWHLDEDPEFCPGEAAFTVERATSYIPSGTHQVIRCLGECDLDSF